MLSKIINFKEPILPTICFLFIFDLFQTFSSWIGNKYITLQYATNNMAVCPPYFQSCLRYYFLDTVPISYGQNILYMVLGVFLFLALYFLYTKEYQKFLFFISIPFLYKIIYQYFLTYLVPGNYNVLGIFFGLVLLFSVYKIFYLRVVFVVFYLCAAVIKLHAGYMTGSIFTSLSLGVPLVPRFFLPYAGMFFFLLCVIPPLTLLFSKNRTYRLSALILLTGFHMYSISMVGFRYSLLLLPLLWLLFYFEKEEIIFEKKYLKDYFAIIAIFVMVLLQTLPLYIKGDERMTGEGYRYGYYMYDGNHQCESHKKIYYKDGSTENLQAKNTTAMYSCDPYEEWFKIKRFCRLEKVQKITWTYDHSLNGLPYRRIVDSEDACVLQYKPFSHNEWIDEDGEVLSKEVVKNSI